MVGSLIGSGGPGTFEPPPVGSTAGGGGIGRATGAGFFPHAPTTTVISTAITINLLASRLITDSTLVTLLNKTLWNPWTFWNLGTLLIATSEASCYCPRE